MQSEVPRIHLLAILRQFAPEVLHLPPVAWALPTALNGSGGPRSRFERRTVSGHKGATVALLHTLLDQHRVDDLWQLEPDYGGGQGIVLSPPLMRYVSSSK
jgi:hypothetical protein